MQHGEIDAGQLGEPMPIATVEFTLRLPVSFHQEGGWFIGEFPNLSLSSQGRTREEAERNLIEAAQLFMESCFARNQLDEALKECGFQPGHADTAPEADYLTVPVELLAARDGSASHAG
jgi:predicted RNase H-like HicB family nuclease